MEYLMTELLDFDINPKPKYAVQSVHYIEVRARASRSCPAQRRAWALLAAQPSMAPSVA